MQSHKLREREECLHAFNTCYCVVPYLKRLLAFRQTSPKSHQQQKRGQGLQLINVMIHSLAVASCNPCFWM